MRIDKLFADNGFGSRRDIKRLLHSRAVEVNGVVCADASFRVDPERDVFTVEGKPFRPRTTVYLMLNKPAGVITSTDDPAHRTVMDLLAPPWSLMDLFPVGRLDLDTEGLLVLTNDGPLTHRLTSPKTGVNKTYLAVLRDPVDEAAFARYDAALRTGITFHDGYTCLPAVLARADNTGCHTDSDASAEHVPSTPRVQSSLHVPSIPLNDPYRAVLLTIREGKYHQVKKMFKALGNEVVYLKRVSMGSLYLDPALAPGAWRELTQDEALLLREGV